MQPEISDLDDRADSTGRDIDNHRKAANNTRLFGPGSPVVSRPNLLTIVNAGNLVVANIKSARKRARQADKSRLHNMGLRSKMRTHIKAVIAAVEKGDKNAAATAYKAAVPVIDSMINKGIVNKNKAARHKSRLNKMIKALAA